VPVDHAPKAEHATADRASGLRPILKWAGGKRRLVAFIAPHLGLKGGGRRLVEPFCGSASLTLALNDDENTFWLSDTNPDLALMYEQLRERPKELMAAVERLFITATNTEEAFYALRDEFNRPTTPLRKASLFVYLNRHSYNGLCRYNASGGFNVPFGRYAQPYAPLAEMESAVPLLRRSRITCLDFRTVLGECGAGDSVYCDPPYLPLSKTASFTQYASGNFGWDDQVALVDAAQMAASRGATVVVSNHATEESRQMYRDAEVHFIDVRRSISCVGENRATAPEMIAVYHPRLLET
jgi:DNA adenine methylase